MKVSNGEYIFNAEAVKRIGLNTLDRINSGDIYNLRIPIANFASGGQVGTVGARSTALGMENFTTEFANNFSPSTKVNVNISERSLMGALNQAIEAKTETFMKKEMQKNAKLNSMLLKRVW